MTTRTSKYVATHVARADEMAAALRQAKLRLTPQRLAICRALADSDAHPTAQAVYAQLRPQFPSLSRATVYNTLDVLVRSGLAHELGTAGDNAVHYDADTSPHVNLVCVQCHRVEDLPGVPLDAIAQQVAQGSGYELQGARVVYYGLCPACRASV